MNADLDDAPDYAAPENEDAPVTMWAAWDDESGIVTSLVPTREEATTDLARLLDEWARDRVAPDNTRVRAFHVHDNGVERTEDPADDCPVCEASA